MSNLTYPSYEESLLLFHLRQEQMSRRSDLLEYSHSFDIIRVCDRVAGDQATTSLLDFSDESKLRAHYWPPRPSTPTPRKRASLVVRRRRPNYKPFNLRWPFLGGLLLVLVFATVLVAYAVHSLPAVKYNQPNISSRSIQRAVIRQEPVAKSTVEELVAPGSGATSAASSTAPAITNTTGIALTAPSLASKATSSTSAGETSESSSVPLAGPLASTLSISSPDDSSVVLSSISSGPAGMSSLVTSMGAGLKSSGVLNILSASSGTISGPVATNNELVSTSDNENPSIVAGFPTTSGSSISSTSSSTATIGTSTLSSYSHPITTAISRDGSIRTTLNSAILTSSIKLGKSSSKTPSAQSVMKSSIRTDTTRQSLTTSTALSMSRSSMQVETSIQLSKTLTTQLLLTQSASTSSTSGIAPSNTASIGTPASLIVNKAASTLSLHHGGSYFAAFFLPTVATVVLAILARMIDVNVSQFQPWCELTRPGGAAGCDSICVSVSGWQSLAIAVRSALRGQPVAALSRLLVICSTILVPLSSEALVLMSSGRCDPSNSGSLTEAVADCKFAINVISEPAMATVTLLVLMSMVVFVLILFLTKWKSGVGSHPWSIASIAGMGANPEVRGLLMGLNSRSGTQYSLNKEVGQKRFELGWFKSDRGMTEYGIVPSDEQAETQQPHVATPAEHKTPLTLSARQWSKPYSILGQSYQVGFLALLSGILGFLLYYTNNSSSTDTSLMKFINSEWFGVRFLFTAIGVVIALVWSLVFSSVALLSPYIQLAARPRTARDSILESPPTNPFHGIVLAVQRRNSFFAAVALATLLSDLLTILLSNIPFRATQASVMSRICTCGAIAILCAMILVVISGFFVRWPPMPVNPATIAGAMYYICDSGVVNDMESTSVFAKKERDWHANSMGKRYEFGPMTGFSGIERIGVNSVEEILND
ncbi:hypothetical protein BX600DRAFT_518371 [Xylariales sp. PMI_506]|nr:hypothetical protein BX600DRAFT_518371 [Xylariales sp. PMI_506]